MKENRVVITGMGVVAPNANGKDNFEAALRAGQSGIRFIPRLEELKMSCQVGGIPQGTDALKEKYFTEEDLLAMNETMIFGSMAAMDAWQDAGLEIPDRNSENVHPDFGAVIGSGLAAMDLVCEKVAPMVNKGKGRRMGSTIVEQAMNSSVAGKVGGLLALGNQVTSNSSACNTGTEAVVDAYRMIKHGYARGMLAGGAEGGSPYMWAGFDSMRVLNSQSNSEPQKASRPLSASAAGFIPGSGSGILILEELENAQARGARIYAEILGAGVNCGGQRNGGSITAPNSQRVQLCIQTALAMSGVSAHEIDYINGHLTGTFADPVEINNWNKGLGLGPGELPPINSTKSLIGHGLGASGGLELAAALIQMEKGFMHPSINCEDLHEEIKPYEKSIVQKQETKNINIIAKASFGFGDVNGALIIKKWQ